MTLTLFDGAFLGSLSVGGYDADAQDFISRVIAADVAAGNTDGLEVGVQDAYNTFVLGCKADGIWPAIKASCILAGARTLEGALVPLVGAAPTNNNFVSGDYNRKTGLAGNGASSYLVANRNNNADPQNSKHLSVYQSTHQTRSINRWTIGGYDGGSTYTGLATSSTTRFSAVNDGLSGSLSEATTSAGFWGVTRGSASSRTMRYAGTNYTSSVNSLSQPSFNLLVFARSGAAAPSVSAFDYSNARISFYSIGESLDLALFDARVTTLMAGLAAAIP